MVKHKMATIEHQNIIEKILHLQKDPKFKRALRQFIHDSTN
ncbi:MAG TPA: hypothetical protein VJH22_06110 [Candidatus Nanoarchaeia archaeon]|nr:hypothetical protein [Candidatus Nanoarchaeia archaeon]